MAPKFGLIPARLLSVLLVTLPVLTALYLYFFLGTETFSDASFLPTTSIITPAGPNFADLSEVSVYNPLLLAVFLLTFIGSFVTPSLPAAGQPTTFARCHLYSSYFLNIFVMPNWRWTSRAFNSPFAILSALATLPFALYAGGSGKSGTAQRTVAQKFEVTPVTILPGTAILLFFNLSYILYKFDVYDLYNRDEPDLIYKIAGNTLGKVREKILILSLHPSSGFLTKTHNSPADADWNY